MFRNMLVFTVLCIFSSNVVFANSALAKQKNCMVCHQMSGKLVGSGFKEIAAQYAGVSDAEEQLTTSILHGKSGRLPMPANPQVSQAEARILAHWVLTGEEDLTAPPPAIATAHTHSNGDDAGPSGAQQLLLALAERGRGSGSTALRTATSPSASGSDAMPSDRSRIIAGSGRTANECVDIRTLSKGEPGIVYGGRVLVNNCSDVVEIFWCYVDTECSREHGSTWSVHPGNSYSVSAVRELRWGACHGPNSGGFEKGSSGLRVVCTGP